MVNEKNNAVGCALSRYNSNRRRWLYLVCNYAFTNIIGKPVYHIGRSASKCTKRHSKYKGLCAASEFIRNEP